MEGKCTILIICFYFPCILDCADTRKHIHTEGASKNHILTEAFSTSEEARMHNVIVFKQSVCEAQRSSQRHKHPDANTGTRKHPIQTENEQR